jgi:hypothetical protein
MSETLQEGQKVNVDGFGQCRVGKLAFNGLLSKHYFAVTKFGDRIRICFNSMLGCWVQFSQH